MLRAEPGAATRGEAVSLARHGEKAGADAVLVVTPYYNKPNQEGLYQHFKAIDAAIGIHVDPYTESGRIAVGPGPYTLACVLVALGLYGMLAGDRSNNLGIFAAGAVLTMAPVIALFQYLQRYIVGGSISGAVKG